MASPAQAIIQSTWIIFYEKHILPYKSRLLPLPCCFGTVQWVTVAPIISYPAYIPALNTMYYFCRLYSLLGHRYVGRAGLMVHCFVLLTTSQQTHLSESGVADWNDWCCALGWLAYLRLSDDKWCMQGFPLYLKYNLRVLSVPYSSFMLGLVRFVHLWSGSHWIFFMLSNT